MTNLDPPVDFSGRALDLHTVKIGTRIGRIYRNSYPDPLGFGKQIPSRFSDPRQLPEDQLFGVLYLGFTLKVCFAETILRDLGAGQAVNFPIEEQEIVMRNYADVEVETPLTVLDLRGDGPLRMRIPNKVTRGGDQTTSRKWSVAFYRHPAQVDGIIYESRLNSDTNLAIYDRSVPKLKALSVDPLIEHVGLPSVINHYRIALV